METADSLLKMNGRIKEIIKRLSFFSWVIVGLFGNTVGLSAETLPAGVVPLAVPPSEKGVLRAERILKKIDDLWRGKSSHGTLSMTVKTVHYTRSMRMIAWSKGKEKSLMRMALPLKEKGTATLKSGSQIYTYLPKTDRTIRLTSGMMMDGWMGSHFTNDDLVKESRLFDDYDLILSFEGEKEGLPIVEITLMPRPDSAVVWGQIVLTVRMEDEMPIQEAYYDEAMHLVRVLTFSDVKLFGGRRLPSRLKMTVVEKPTEFTELVYEEMVFDVDLDDRFFSLSNLRGP